jgi:hypothetical protein
MVQFYERIFTAKKTLSKYWGTVFYLCEILFCQGSAGYIRASIHTLAELVE